MNARRDQPWDPARDEKPGVEMKKEAVVLNFEVRLRRML
jgi:hypothetical protein